ncbi:DUF4118 domain-containing protein [Sphingomonas oligophenolica]|uniref:DUF4118 domain-containing protein n=1 Tax=Sphingomonas oligophenolica TaxID=301154 RepID=A0A502C1D1_9SPHN|nr:DUF4118 domain-containing protein [Sphingomonas oligophenolica]TPG06552.1 DUF4118 domain-containing protein [Sphingomonas oligophenolica]
MTGVSTPDGGSADHLPNKKRGRLRLFVGVGPGPAVTDRMLQVVDALQEAGREVVVAVRPESRRQTALPRDVTVGTMEQNGQAGEPDLELDELLAKCPAAVAVTDLAHDNLPNARHRRRWQDVEDLLAAGIDVFTTVDAASLASMKDVAEAITGTSVDRTVPDALFDAAELEVVDSATSPEQGRVLSQPATSGLRVLTLRRAALAIDHQIDAHQEGAPGSLVQAMDRVLVAVSGSRNGPALIRAAKRLATALHAPFHAIHVETPRGERDLTARRRAADALGLAAKLGATISTVPATGVAKGIDHHLLASPASHLVLGGSSARGLARMFFRSLLADMLERHRGLSLHVPSQGSDETEMSSPPVPLAKGSRPGTPPVHYLYAVAMVAATIATAELLRVLAGARGLNLLFLLPVIAAAARFRIGPALVAAIASIFCVNFFLLAPELSLKLAAPQNVVLVAVLGGVAVYTNLITAQLRGGATLSARSAQENAGLVSFAQGLARASDWEETARCVCREISSQLNVQAVMLREKDGDLAVTASCPADAKWGPIDQAALDWCWHEGQATGSGTMTLAAGEWRFEPLKTSLGTLAVLGIVRDDGRNPISADRSVLFATLVIQAALAHERLKLEDGLRRGSII